MTNQGIIQAIMDCHIPGVGEGMARRIAERYGEETIERLMRGDIGDLCVPGIGPKRMEALRRRMAQLFGAETSAVERRANRLALMTAIRWRDLGISPRQRAQIEQAWGMDALEVINGNPYRLMEIGGYGFRRADEVARSVGIALDDVRRIRAALVFVMDEKALDGHTCQSEDALVLRAACKQVLGVSQEAVRPVLAECIADGTLRRSLDMIYLPKYLEAEVEVAERILGLMNYIF